jgi:ABC-type cobalamin/Fe3+-siderophores transport system ATPase subunit
MNEIVIDIRGPNAAGKTTLLQMIHEKLEDWGFEVVLKQEDLQELEYQAARMTPTEHHQRHEAVRARVTVHLMTTPTRTPFPRQ